MFNALNFVAYQVAWFAAVLGAAHGFAWAGTALALLVTTVHLVWRRDALDLKLVIAALVIGFAVDSALAFSGQVQFAAAWSPSLAPLWMLALWAAFATTLNHSLHWLMSRPAAAALGGALGGPLAYLAGERLGAIKLAAPGVALPLIAALWIAAMCAFCLLLRGAPLRTARGLPA